MDAQKVDLCRLCLGSINGCDEILLNDNPYLVKSIFLITGLKVVSDSGQSEYVCNQCRALLEQCVEFRVTCIHNDGVFRELISGLDHPDDSISELQKPVDEFIILESVDLEAPASSVHDELDNSHELPQEVTERISGLDHPDDSKSELQEPVDEFIKLEPVDLEAPAGSVHDELDNNHEMPQKVAEPSVEREGESKEGNICRAGAYHARKGCSRKVQCLQCDKLVTCKYLSRHQKIHEPNREKLCCPHCPKEYMGTKELREHILAKHTEGVQYDCELCGKNYTTRNSLREHHLMVHSNEKRYACNICGERFARGATRYYHQRTAHTTARPFTCERCNNTFKTKSRLTDHLRHHKLREARNAKLAAEASM